MFELPESTYSWIFFFPAVSTAVLHDLQVVESADKEHQMQKSNCEVMQGFSTAGSWNP